MKRYERSGNTGLFLLLLSGATLLLLSSGACIPSPVSNATNCRGERKILVWSIRGDLASTGGNMDVVCADGSGTVSQGVQRQIESASQVSFSPDGKKVAFVQPSPQDFKDHISIINTDGSGLVRLSRSYGYESDPAWSPDGQRLAFYAYITGPLDEGVYVTDVTCLNTDQDCASTATLVVPGGSSPTWSPDGTRIAFKINDAQNDSDHNYEIYVISVDGSNRLNLTNSKLSDSSPAWSPDGQLIAFYSSRDPSGIYLMHADGSSQTYLADGFQPAWSPDSYYIAFISTRDSGGKEIQLFDSSPSANALYLATRDGTKTIRLTHHEREVVTNFAWLPQAPFLDQSERE